MTSKRIEYIDVAKGIAIFIVVYGHSGVKWIFPYISWVQMTFFFFLGGVLFKNALEKKQSNLSWINAKIKHLIIPYIVFGSLMYAFFFVVSPDLLPDARQLIIGGVELKGIYGVYWFITVYLATSLVFNYVSQLKRNIQFAIIIAMNLLGHVLTMTANEPRVIFWNLDVVLISTTYFAFGYYLKDFLYIFKDFRVIIVSWFLVGLFVMLQINDVMDLRMGMKYKQFAHPFIDAIVPLICIVAMMGLIQIISKYIDFVKVFGEASLYIMYLHIPQATAFRILFD
ncbi:MAG TPA: acyltransferase family protein, partial [Acidimicrobiia bacterium]|nr:acyltransferase family protein [Acidimicrobiia bacterium]